MRIKTVLATGYIATTLLGSFCPVLMGAALAQSEPTNYHAEMMEIAMTPMLPMTLATPVMMLSASHPVSMSFSKNCQTGLCIGNHSNQSSPSLVAISVSVQLAKRAPPFALPSPVFESSIIAQSAAPEWRSVSSLAQTISTVVLRT